MALIAIFLLFTGQLGHGDTHDRDRPEMVTSFDGMSITSAAVGISHTLFLDTNGRVFGTGYSGDGELGLDLPEGQNKILRPEELTMLSEFGVAQIAAGASHSMARTRDGHLYVWGEGDVGQLGLGSTGLTSLLPKLLEELPEVTDLDFQTQSPPKHRNC